MIVVIILEQEESITNSGANTATVFCNSNAPPHPGEEGRKVSALHYLHVGHVACVRCVLRVCVLRVPWRGECAIHA